ncbi:MAG: DNA polymerase I [Gammaproteobacteria bacterium]|nr:DNA polymerase I [Gammaproteobacteria bacterium]MCZ6911290.1 DNA polymerase I [Pseudomonadota bacterium]
MPEKKKALVLVDGSSYLYRAFHALPPLTTSKGEPTGAIHGVLNMLQKLIRDYEPEHIAVVFDAGGKTFRDEMYEEYKANRPPMPDELRSQIDPILEAVRAMGLPLLQTPGVEADDVIGTLARWADQEKMPTVISTGDKDMAQLVNDNISLINTMTGKSLDRDGVKEKFDVYPEQIVDFLALTGDSSDNIPGVPKVGPKTAAKWLKDHKTLDEIVAHADQIKGKVGESLRANLEQLELSRKLATIRCDLELGQSVQDLTPGEPDIGGLRKLYQRLEMNSLLRKLPEAEVETAAAKPVSGNYQTIFSKKEFSAWLKKLEKAKLIAFDTETDSLDYMNAQIVGLSFAIKEGEAAYLPVAHDYPGAPDQLSRDEVLAALQPLLENPKVQKVGHHLKYDAHILANYGIRMGGMQYDSMLESYVLNSTATRHDMDSVASRYLGVETISFEDVAGKGAKQLTFNQVPLEQAGPYAAEDADITLRLHHELWRQLKELPTLRNLYEKIEQPLVPVLLRMERTGVLLDADLLQEQSAEIAVRLLELEKQSHEAAGQPFNLGSPKQLQEILFEKQKLPIIRKTPKGQPSTAEDVLQELAENYELPRLILDYRLLAKLKSTYTDRLPEQINLRTGRVHTSYHQAVAATGRLSSSDPNLQNIPIRTAEGRRIRQAFVATEGHRLLAADYSQIELRIMAHLSGDEGLLQAFANDQDIHRATAAEVFSVAPDDVSDDQRRSAKAINFGLIYGMSAFGLARQLNIRRSEAQDYVDLYFGRYPGVKAYMRDTRQLARDQGFVETVFGRRLYLPEINARNSQRRQYAERSAINAPMQGTAADIIKMAMVQVDDWIQRDATDIRLLMQVHDELVLEVPESRVEAASERIGELMTGAASLNVPLKVDLGSGANWDEAH